MMTPEDAVRVAAEMRREELSTSWSLELALVGLARKVLSLEEDLRSIRDPLWRWREATEGTEPLAIRRKVDAKPYPLTASAWAAGLLRTLTSRDFPELRPDLLPGLSVEYVGHRRQEDEGLVLVEGWPAIYRADAVAAGWEVVERQSESE